MKKLISFLLASAFAVSMLTATASAEAYTGGFVKPEDESILVAYPDGEKEPTLSFDRDSCLKYITVSEDGVNEAGMWVTNQSAVRYQGGCLKIAVNNEKQRGNVEGGDLPYVYEYGMGIQLNAADFGLENFDGCVISMMVKFHPDALAALDNSAATITASEVVAEGEEGYITGSRTITYSELEAKGFRNAILTIMEPKEGEYGDTTSFSINLPLTGVYSGDVFYIDNLTIKTPLKDADGNDLYVKNVDGYNASASVDNTENIVQAGDTVTADSVVLESVAEEAGEGGKGMIIAIVIIAVVVIVGIGVFILIKMKNRYY
ncbi:MAG: hypothetical protein IJC65_08385 [Oscillospiraceae bacterium]|nr:hypothetical protein [Oscillospiraceae bacterium]